MCVRFPILLTILRVPSAGIRCARDKVIPRIGPYWRRGGNGVQALGSQTVPLTPQYEFSGTFGSRGILPALCHWYARCGPLLAPESVILMRPSRHFSEPIHSNLFTSRHHQIYMITFDHFRPAMRHPVVGSGREDDRLGAQRPRCIARVRRGRARTVSTEDGHRYRGESHAYEQLCSSERERRIPA